MKSEVLQINPWPTKTRGSQLIDVPRRQDSNARKAEGGGTCRVGHAPEVLYLHHTRQEGGSPPTHSGKSAVPRYLFNDRLSGERQETHSDTLT